MSKLNSHVNAEVCTGVCVYRAKLFVGKEKRWRQVEA